MCTNQDGIFPVEEVKLRAGDMGTLKGKFEIHFGCVKFPKNIDLTQRLCYEWNKRVSDYVLENNLDREEVSLGFDRMFEEFFNVKLEKGRHVTIEKTEIWKKLHVHFLDQVKLVRTVRRAGRSDDDRSR